MPHSPEYFGVFTASFLAATILPMMLFPFIGGVSLLLLITGYAYVIAGIAWAVYCVLSFRT